MSLSKSWLMVLAALLAVDAVEGQRAANTVGRPCVATPGRIAHPFSGELKAGELFEQAAGPFILRVEPDDFVLRQRPADNPNPGPSFGWHIMVRERGRDDDLSQFTTPFRGPNARDLYPWFDGSGQMDGARPGPQRNFYFSPEVGRTIVWEDDATKRRANTARIEAWGQGMLDILEYRSTPPTRDGSVGFEWIKFSACLSWPR